MIVKRIWKKRINSFECKHYRGWFLFGFIPLYIKQCEDTE